MNFSICHIIATWIHHKPKKTLRKPRPVTRLGEAELRYDFCLQTPEASVCTELRLSCSPCFWCTASVQHNSRFSAVGNQHIENCLSRTKQQQRKHRCWSHDLHCPSSCPSCCIAGPGVPLCQERHVELAASRTSQCCEDPRVGHDNCKHCLSATPDQRVEGHHLETGSSVDPCNHCT